MEKGRGSCSSATLYVDSPTGRAEFSFRVSITGHEEGKFVLDSSSCPRFPVGQNLVYSAHFKAANFTFLCTISEVFGVCLLVFTFGIFKWSWSSDLEQHLVD